MRRSQRRRLAQQQLCRVGAVFLPVSETSVEDVSPESCPITIDVLFALRRERCGLLKGDVTAWWYVSERATGFEPVTSSLGSWHSTPELRPRCGRNVRAHPAHCQSFTPCDTATPRWRPPPASGRIQSFDWAGSRARSR